MKQIVENTAFTGFSWTYCLEPTDKELYDLAELWEIPQLYIQDVLQAEHLPKVEPIAGQRGRYFILMRALMPGLEKKDFNAIQQFSRKLAVFYAPDQLVTIQRNAFPWMEPFLDSHEQDGEPISAFQFTSKLIKATFRSYEPFIQQLAADLDFFENKVFENEKFPPFAKNLYALRRKASLLRRLFHLSEPLTDWLKEKGEQDPVAQDALDMAKRVNNMAEDVYERVVGLINLNLTINSQRSNEVMRFLTIYSAFFMPLTFLVGVYGMNFQVMPELSWQYGYVLCWILMVGIFVGHWLWFRKKRWL